MNPILEQPTQPAAEPGGNNNSGNEPFTAIEGLPDDVPFLAENNGDLSKTISQGMTIYVYSSNMPYDQVVEFFKTSMEKNGWTVMSETTQDGNGSWTYTLGEDQSRMVMISLATDGEISQITEMLISQ